jgi:dienelactone hydrolase
MIPPEMVEQFRDLLAAHRAAGHELHVLPGRHFFANVSRPRRYRADSTEQAWAIVLEFLAVHMRARPDEAGQSTGTAPRAR